MSQAEIYKHLLREISDAELKYTSGFALSKPERWVPTIGNYWLRFFQILQINFNLISIKPGFDLDLADKRFYQANCAEGNLAIAIDKDTAYYLSELVYDETNQSIAEAGLEYLICRLLGSVADSWSGQDFSSFKYAGFSDSLGFNAVAHVRLEASINSRNCQIDFLLEESIVMKLDGLWSRQTSTIQFGGLSEQAAVLRFAHFSEKDLKLEAGSIIQIEDNFNPARVELLTEDRVLDCQLLRYQDNLVIKVGQVISPVLPPDSVQVLSQDFMISAENSGLLNKSGSLLPLSLELNSKLKLTRNKEAVNFAEFIMADQQVYLRTL